MQYEVVDIRTRDTAGKGSLSFFEAGEDFSFEIKRVYYIYDVPMGSERGGHAHRNLSQIMFCPNGAIEVILDDGVERVNVMLDNPSKALIISDMIWREMLWRKEESVLVVGASSHYDEADYIRDYDEFIRAISTANIK